MCLRYERPELLQAIEPEALVILERARNTPLHYCDSLGGVGVELPFVYDRLKQRMMIMRHTLEREAAGGKTPKSSSSRSSDSSTDTNSRTDSTQDGNQESQDENHETQKSRTEDQSYHLNSDRADQSETEKKRKVVTKLEKLARFLDSRPHVEGPFCLHICNLKKRVFVDWERPWEQYPPHRQLEVQDYVVRKHAYLQKEGWRIVKVPF